MSKLTNKLFDKRGNQLAVTNPLKKKAFAQFGSIYEFPNFGRFRPRWYTNQDTELGASSLTRDLLMRWSRELCAQLPWVYSAIRTLALFSVGSAYQPQYQGNNEAWGKQAIKWLTEEFYPNCNKRGPAFDFNTTMFVGSLMLDQDGDFLSVYGEENGFPKIQIIPAHRITSMGSMNSQEPVFPTPNSLTAPSKGPFPNTVVSDGVVYDKQGCPLGYNITNPDNLVNSILGNQNNLFFSAKNSQLIYDQRFFDRGRGLPSLSSGILQGISLQEIEQYQVEKIKIQSMIAYTESTPNGEGPQDEANAMQRMLAQDEEIGGFPGESRGFNNSTQGLRIVNGPTIKYLNAAGGKIEFPTSNVAEDMQEYITRLESHVLQSLGVPHAIIFSQGKVSGRMSDGVAKLFNASINYRQKILDKWANFICAWAVAKAIKNGDLPPNDDENLSNIFSFTHPAPFSLNDGYDRASDVTDYQGGLKTLSEILAKRNVHLHDFMKDTETEKTAFFEMANRIAKTTNTDLSIVLASLQDTLVKNTASDKLDTGEQEVKEENER